MVVSQGVSIFRERLTVWVVNNFVFCKTEEGYWCSLSLPVKTIRLIEEHLKKDPMLENL